MKYKEYSDLDINKLIAAYMYPNAEEITDHFSRAHVIIEVGVTGFYRNYCESPVDAWPVIESIWSTLMTCGEYDLGLGLGPSGVTLWDAQRWLNDCGKLRAAMIVYLTTKDNEK
jgi:hypothetical protein